MPVRCHHHNLQGQSIWDCASRKSGYDDGRRMLGRNFAGCQPQHGGRIDEVPRMQRGEGDAHEHQVSEGVAASLQNHHRVNGDDRCKKARGYDSVQR